jgi:hypothetical protein
MPSIPRPEGFNIEPLYGFKPGDYVDAIPPGERWRYMFRGVGLGALALNLAYGVNRINPRDDLYMHVAVGAPDAAHEYAAGHAQSLGRSGGFPGHLTFAELDVLAESTGRTGFHPLPGIVIGLPFDKYIDRLVPHPLTFHPAIHEEVPFSEIDPYSQAEISRLTGIDVSALPPTPGATRPVFESPIDIA